MPPIGSLGKNNRRGTLPPPPSYYDGPAYTVTKGSKPGAASNGPVKRQPAGVKYGNKVAQGGAVGAGAGQASLVAQSSVKYNKPKATVGPSSNTVGATGSGVGKQGTTGGGKYISPSSLRNLAVKEQI